MERSERSSSGKAAGVPASPTQGAPGRGHALGEGGAAPPADPDDPDARRDAGLAAGEEGAAVEPVRAEPWEPDAELMRALGLELEELRGRVEAGDPDRGDRGDEPRRPARPPSELGEPAAAPPAPPSPSDGRPPWW